MKINYKLVVFSMLFMLFFTYTAQAQLEEGDVIWQDMFDDAENDYLLNNVGWLYFGEDDGLVGQEAAQSLIDEIKSGAAVDHYLSDQLLIYMVLRSDCKIKTSKISNHAKTNIYVIEQFLDVGFKVNGNKIACLE